MTLRTIIQPDNPVLRRKARRVVSFDRRFQRLVDDMLKTMKEASGIGLAAPQVGVSQRVFVVRLPEDSEEAREEFGADALVSFHVAVAVDGIVAALQSMAIVVYSFALVFIGLGMSEASPYPRWLGWSAIALGAATVPTGILWANTTETLVYAFGVLAALTALWAITVGVWITRKVW